MSSGTTPAPRSVVIVGFDELAMRLIDAVRGDPQLRLAAVHDEDPRQRERTAALGLPTAAPNEVPHDAQIIRMGEQSVVARLGTCETIPSADCLAWRRIVAALAKAACPPERAFLLILERSTRVDCLTPRFGAANDVDGWMQPDSPSLVVQRVQVPYDRSNVHVLQIGLRKAVEREDVLTALRAAPHMLVARAADGLPHTAALQEKRRDGGSPAGDGPEVVVWEESIDVQGLDLYMTVDVCPFATPVPETLAALRPNPADRTGGVS